MHGEELEEFRGPHGEPVGELENPIERDGLLCTLDAPNLVPMEVTQLRELLLGEMPFFP